MIESKIKERMDSIGPIVERLGSAARFEFSTLFGPSELPQAEGVYVIWDKYTEEVLYVGKTTNLRRRIYTNHLMGPLTNARLKKYLIEDSNFSEIKDKVDAKDYIRNQCAFTFLLEPDFRKRGHLEGLIGFLCDCRYVDMEH